MSENLLSDYGWFSGQHPASCNFVAPGVIALLAKLKLKRVLDLGAGNGVLSSLMAR